MRFFIIAIFVFLSFAPTALVRAQTTGINTGGPDITLINPLKGVDCSSSGGDCLMAFLKNILTYVIRIGTIVIILMIVYVGYLFVIAQGKPGEIEKARSALLWTVVGALILLGSQAIAISIKATVTSLGG